jgi:serine/threonine protein kinase
MAMTSLPYGRFEFNYEDEVGAGGLGRVHRIRVTASNAVGITVGSTHACKRLNEKWARHPTMRERFEREIGATRRMSHASIVTCVGENLPDGERFYIMPLYTSTLRRFIASGTHRGDWRFFAQHAVRLAEAMQYAHDCGFVHRDLKPDNVLFNKGGPLVIADWGLGYFVHKESKVLQQLTRGGMGTEYYCSLEQWNTGKCDGRGDIYSLGMMLDECVTGVQRPIVVGMGINAACVTETDAGARLFNGLLRRMTHAFAFGRPENMAAVAAELQVALGAA